jgi:hypothetical protein
LSEVVEGLLDWELDKYSGQSVTMMYREGCRYQSGGFNQLVRSALGSLAQDSRATDFRQVTIAEMVFTQVLEVEAAPDVGLGLTKQVTKKDNLVNKMLTMF